MVQLLSQYSENIITTLNVFWKGMLGVFLVIGLIGVTVYLLNRGINKAQEKRKQALQQKNGETDEGN